MIVRRIGEKMIEVFHSNDGGYYADEKKEEEKEDEHSKQII